MSRRYASTIESGYLVARGEYHIPSYKDPSYRSNAKIVQYCDDDSCDDEEYKKYPMRNHFVDGYLHDDGSKPDESLSFQDIRKLHNASVKNILKPDDRVACVQPRDEQFTKELETPRSNDEKIVKPKTEYPKQKQTRAPVRDPESALVGTTQKFGGTWGKFHNSIPKPTAPKIDKCERVYAMWKELVRVADTPKYVKNSINKGDVWACLTVKIFGFQKFYVHMIEKISQFQAFEAHMRESLMSTSGNVPREGTLMQGKYLAVILKRENGEPRLWYRAQIIYLMSENRAGVQLIDYGDTHFVNRHDMRWLPRIFLLEQEAMAIPCQFRLAIADQARKTEILNNDMDMGQLLKQYLSDRKDEELVKFHHRQVEPDSNRVVWVITTMLFDSMHDKFATPHMTLCEAIAWKLIDRKEDSGPRIPPQNDCTDWNNEGVDSAVNPTSVFDSWILREDQFCSKYFPWLRRKFKNKESQKKSAVEITYEKHFAVFEESESAARIHEVFDLQESYLLEGEIEAENNPQQLNEYDRASDEYMEKYCSGAFGGCRTKSTAR